MCRPRRCRPPPAPLRWRAGLAVATCAGCGPSPSFGGGLFVGLARERLGLDVGVRADLPDTSSGPSGRELRSSLVVGEIFPHARIGILRLGLLGSMGALLGTSDGENQTSLFAAAGVRAGLEWRVTGPVFMRLAIDGSLALARVSLRVEGRELWSTPAITGGASLAGGVEF